jgi:hypothetical protein
MLLCVHKIGSIPSSIDGCPVNFPECDVFLHNRLVNSAPVDNLHHQVSAQVEADNTCPWGKLTEGDSGHFFETHLTSPTERAQCIAPTAREVGTTRSRSKRVTTNCNYDCLGASTWLCGASPLPVLSKTTPEKRPEKAHAVLSQKQ